MTTFLDSLKQHTNLTTTENGAVTNRSALDPVVDFFGLAGGMRDDPVAAADLFEKAYHADPQTAVRVLFYLRDVRGGQGERDVFRAGLRRLSRLSPSQAARVLDHVAFYGRWDDLFAVAGDLPRAAMVGLIRDQLDSDLINHALGRQVSLLAKWMPSENASSPETKKLARELRTALGETSASYRRTLSMLRARIHLLEQDMSANRWSEINFGNLPSQAHRRHTKAFHRHQPGRYQAYLDSVERGEAKINVSTVYPYELYEMAKRGESAADVMWENLPDYTDGRDALVMADVSGSMYGRPMSVSVSLALYFAERNRGAFKGHFMTFSKNPQLVKVQGKNLASRLASIESGEWGMNTDLLAAFRAILDAAEASGEAPPSTLYVVSDMEFDAATASGYGYSARPKPQDTVFKTAEREFRALGHELPHVVFWNVNARNMQVPATILDGRVSLVSGLSPTVFAMAVEGKSPRELVDSVVNAERYQRIVL